MISVGRMVSYRLLAEDVRRIMWRRTTYQSITARLAEDRWPTGAQAHIGNAVTEGMLCPMLVVRVWSPDGPVNGQVFLDGTDVLWVTSVVQGPGHGQWSWSS